MVVERIMTYRSHACLHTYQTPFRVVKRWKWAWSLRHTQSLCCLVSAFLVVWCESTPGRQDKWDERYPLAPGSLQHSTAEAVCLGKAVSLPRSVAGQNGVRRWSFLYHAAWITTPVEHGIMDHGMPWDHLDSGYVKYSRSKTKAIHMSYFYPFSTVCEFIRLFMCALMPSLGSYQCSKLSNASVPLMSCPRRTTVLGVRLRLRLCLRARLR